MKFNLVVNSDLKDGFKLSVISETSEELEIAKELTLKLIDKIKSIEVKVLNHVEEDY